MWVLGFEGLEQDPLETHKTFKRRRLWRRSRRPWRLLMPGMLADTLNPRGKLACFDNRLV